MKAKTLHDALISAKDMESTVVEVVEEAGSKVYELYQVEVTDVTTERCNSGVADKKINKRVLLRVKPM